MRERDGRRDGSTHAPGAGGRHEAPGIGVGKRTLVSTTFAPVQLHGAGRRGHSRISCPAAMLRCTPRRLEVSLARQARCRTPRRSNGCSAATMSAASTRTLAVRPRRRRRRWGRRRSPPVITSPSWARRASTPPRTSSSNAAAFSSRAGSARLAIGTSCTPTRSMTRWMSITRVASAPEGKRVRTAAEEAGGWAFSLGGAAVGAKAGAAAGAALGWESGPRRHGK
jgi:hypothetical protein